MRSVFGATALTLLPALIAALLPGCPDQPVAPVGVPAPGAVTRGILRAASSRHVDGNGDFPVEPFAVTAVFARYDPEFEDLLSSLLPWQREEPEVGLDACGPPLPVLGVKQPRPVPGETAIQLLDAGNLTLAVEGEELSVSTRTFPDLLKVVDGVMYSIEESRGARFSPGAGYSFRSNGTDLVGPFEVVLEAPEDLGEVKLDGVSPTEQPPAIRRGEDLAITWEGAGWGDEVIAEFTWTNLGLPWSMECRMRDDGLFVVPGDRTRGLQDPLRSGNEELTLSRVRQVAFRASGLSSGTFAFVVAAGFPVRFDGPN
jgi:hypothetical protein